MIRQRPSVCGNASLASKGAGWERGPLARTLEELRPRWLRSQHVSRREAAGLPAML